MLRKKLFSIVLAAIIVFSMTAVSASGYGVASATEVESGLSTLSFYDGMVLEDGTQLIFEGSPLLEDKIIPSANENNAASLESSASDIQEFSVAPYAANAGLTNFYIEVAYWNVKTATVVYPSPGYVDVQMQANQNEYLYGANLYGLMFKRVYDARRNFVVVAREIGHGSLEGSTWTRSGNDSVSVTPLTTIYTFPNGSNISNGKLVVYFIDNGNSTNVTRGSFTCRAFPNIGGPMTDTMSFE